jgi:hypothetical protein
MIKKAQSSNKFVRSQNAPSKGQYESVTNERHCRASGLVHPPKITCRKFFLGPSRAIAACG